MQPVSVRDDHFLARFKDLFSTIRITDWPEVPLVLKDNTYASVCRRSVVELLGIAAVLLEYERYDAMTQLDDVSRQFIINLQLMDVSFTGEIFENTMNFRSIEWYGSSSVVFIEKLRPMPVYFGQFLMDFTALLSKWPGTDEECSRMMLYPTLECVMRCLLSGPTQLQHYLFTMSTVRHRAIDVIQDFNTKHCATCGQSGVHLKCSLCKSVYYCSVECQKIAWPSHKRAGCCSSSTTSS